MRIVRSTDRPFVPASHEHPDKPGVLKRVLATHEEMLKGRPQMINWARLPVGSSFRRHYHEDMEEIFIIVHGTAEMKIADQTIRLEPGDAAVVSPREVHSMTNICSIDVQYIVVGISLGQNGQTVVVE